MISIYFSQVCYQYSAQCFQYFEDLCGGCGFGFGGLVIKAVIKGLCRECTGNGMYIDCRRPGYRGG